MAPSPYICSGILEAEVITTLPGCRVQDDGIPAIQVCAVQPMQEDAVACLYVREDRCVLRLPLSITRRSEQLVKRALVEDGVSRKPNLGTHGFLELIGLLQPPSQKLTQEW